MEWDSSSSEANGRASREYTWGGTGMVESVRRKFLKIQARAVGAGMHCSAFARSWVWLLVSVCVNFSCGHSYAG